MEPEPQRGLNKKIIMMRAIIIIIIKDQTADLDLLLQPTGVASTLSEEALRAMQDTFSLYETIRSSYAPDHSNSIVLAEIG